MLKDNVILWLARNENRNLIDSNGTVTGREKLMCPFCSGEVYVLPGFGFIHQNSPCTKDPSAFEASQIQIIAEEMLMAGHNLYVKPVSSNGRLLAPDKINTRKGTNFQRNMDINGLAADLTWTSSKGFRMGVSFSSQDALPSSLIQPHLPKGFDHRLYAQGKRYFPGHDNLFLKPVVTLYGGLWHCQSTELCLSSLPWKPISMRPTNTGNCQNIE